MRSAANSLEQCVLFLPGTFVRFGVFWWVAAALCFFSLYSMVFLRFWAVLKGLERSGRQVAFIST